MNSNSEYKEIFESNNKSLLFARVASDAINDGEFEKALSILETGIHLFEEYPTPYFLMGDLLIKLNKIEEAKNAFQKGNSLLNNSSTLNNFLNIKLDSINSSTTNVEPEGPQNINDSLEELNNLEEVNDSEELKDLEEINDLEELKDLEEVNNLEDLNNLKEVNDSEDLNDLEEVNDLEDLNDLEEVNDLEELKDLEEGNNLEDLKDLKELNDLEDLKDLKELNDLEILKDLEEVNDSEELKDLEEVNDSEELKDLEEINDLEELNDLEEVNDSEELNDLEEVNALENLENKLKTAKIELDPETDFEPKDEGESKSGDEYKPLKGLVSETLASIYINQSNYNEAKAIYETLIDIQPEREEYFQYKLSEIDSRMRNRKSGDE